MSRGYRLLVIALVGLVLTGAHKPSAQPHGADGSADHPVAVKLIPPLITPFTPYPGYDPDPCYRAKDSNQSNLCAYWRSAIAAENSVRESRRATNWAIAGIISSFFTLAGLVFTIFLTNGALKAARLSNKISLKAHAHARREATTAANAMRHANEIAHDSAKRELRAYALPVEGNIQYGGGLIRPQFIVRLHNGGQTPAYNLQAVCAYSEAPYGTEPGWPGTYPARFKKDLKLGSKMDLAPGNEIEASVEFIGSPMNLANRRYIVVFGYVRYFDTFKRLRRSTFKFFYDAGCHPPTDPLELKTVRLIPCCEGNRSN